MKGAVYPDGGDAVCSLGKSAGKLSRLEAWTTPLEADIYKVNCAMSAVPPCGYEPGCHLDHVCTARGELVE